MSSLDLPARKRQEMMQSGNYTKVARLYTYYVKKHRTETRIFHGFLILARGSKQKALGSSEKLSFRQGERAEPLPVALGRVVSFFFLIHYFIS